MAIHPLLWLALPLIAIALLATATAADVRYIYDDLGRLSQVIDDQGNVATYTYDAVGNILSITRSTGGVGAPAITSITPTSASQSTVVSVTIAGQNLQGGAVTTDNPGIGVSNVHTSPASINATFTIDLTARAGATVVTVKTTIGTATVSFTVVPKTPEITSLTPLAGPPSRLVTIFGRGFNPVPAQNLVRFNDSTATVFAATPFRLDTAVPLDAPIGPVSVTVTANLLTSNAKPFVVTAGAPPTITSITPDRGSAQGGEQVTIVGTGFVSVISVKIGASSATNVVTVNATTITARTPAGTAGPADVVVTTSGGDARLAGGYTFIGADPERVVAITPTPGLTNAPINAPVTVLFTRPVDRLTITTASYSLKVSSSGAAVAGTFSFDQNDTLVTFRPSANLAPNTSYTIALTQDIRSTETIHLDGPFAGSFVTAVVPDTISPTVQVRPANGASNVPFNSVIVFSFSEAMNPNTVTLANLKVTNLSIERAGTLTLSQQNTVATFVPASPFVPGTSVTVRLSGKVTDAAGNAIVGSAGVGSDLVTSFTTAQTQDVLPPVVLNVNPPNNATGINAATTIAVTFNESVDPASMSTDTFRVSSNGVAIPGSIVLSNFATVATFLPTSLLPGLAQIDVAVGPGVRDLAGNAMVAAFTSRFTTQQAIDNFQPSVTAVNPPPGATKVPVNVRVTIAFSERINPATITSTSFRLSNPVLGVVPGTITIAPNQLAATFTPAQPLLASTTHTITYTADIRDLAGNPLLNPTGQLNNVTFTTGVTTGDAGGPTVLTVSPAPSAQNVPTNSPVVIQFSEPIAATSVTDQTVVVSRGGVPVPTTITLEQNNTIVRLASANFIPLQANAFHNLAVTTGVSDLAGNPLLSAFTSGFTTGTGVDTAPPTIVSVTPTFGAVNVSVLTSIGMTFSEPLNPTTVTSSRVALTGGGADGAIAGTLALSADRRTVTLTRSAPLFAGQLFSITTADVEDLVGNHFVMTNPPPVRFTTDVMPSTAFFPLAATAVPAVSSLFANGQTVTAITISNVNRNGVLAPNGTLVAVTAAPAYRTASAGGTIVGGLPSPDPRFRLFPTVGGAVTIFYQSPSRPDLINGVTATANVQVAAVDGAGSPTVLIGSTGNAITLSASKAAFVSTNPVNVLANGSSFAEVSVFVTNNANAAAPSGVRLAVTAATVFAPSAGGTIVGGLPSPDGRFSIFTTTPGGVFTFNYVAPALGPNQAASAVIQVAEADDAGNVIGLLGSATINLNGTTGFSGPQPVVLSVTPPNGSSGVGTNALVAAEFSQPLDPASVTASTFSVSRSGGPVVTGTRTLSSGPRGPNTIVTFSPSAALTPSVSHSISITTGIRSAAGTPLLATSSTTFSTHFGADLTAPTIIGSNPPDGATGVPTNAPVTLQASETLNASTVNAATVTLTQGGIPIGGRVTVGTGSAGPNSLITFTPDQVLAINTAYTVTAATGITDIVGNGLAAPFSATFTTGVVVDTTGPTLTSMSPFNGQTGVPLNAHVVVQFDEPVSPISVHAGTFNLTGVFTAPATIEVSPDGRTITLIPLQALTANLFHKITVTSGVTDRAGNPLTNPPSNQGFTTGGTPTDASGPQILNVSPAHGALNVPTNAHVSVQFSEPVAAASVNADTLSVTVDNVVVPGSIALTSSNTLARWTPAATTLEPSKLHTLRVTTGITDMAGNALAAGSVTTFTTVGLADTTPFSIVSVRMLSSGQLLNGATGVSVTESYVVTFNKAADPVGLIPFLTGGGMDAGLGGTSTYSGDRTALTFTPAQPLFANGQYTLNIFGAADLAGNTVPNQGIASFRAAVAPGTDLNALPASASLPGSVPTVFANGQNALKVIVTNVSRSGPIVPNGTRVAVSVEPAYRINTAGGTIVGGTPSIDPRFRIFTTEGGGFTFVYRTPNRPDLIRGVSAQVITQVASVDASGRPAGLLSTNAITLVNSRLATVAANPTTILANGTSTSELTVTVTDPAGLGVPAGVRIGVTAQPVYVGTSAGGTNPVSLDTAFTVAQTGVPVSGRIFPGPSISLPNTVAIFVPDQALVPGTVYTVALTAAATDAAGNALVPFTSSFTTGVEIGTIPPSVVNVSPFNGETNVPLNVVPTLRFDAPVNPVTVNTTTLTLNGGFALGDRPGTVSVSPDGLTATFTPTELLVANFGYTLKYTNGIMDFAGNRLSNANQISFTTGGTPTDAAGPQVLIVHPASGATGVPLNAPVLLLFSEPLAAPTVTPQSVVVSAGGNAIPGLVSFDNATNSLVRWVPAAGATLAPSTPHAITVSTSVTDISGNPLPAPFASTFTTGLATDVVPPTVSTIVPANGAVNVAATTTVAVTFSEAIDPATLDYTSTFRLTGGGVNGNIAGTFAVSSDGRTVTFTPNAPLFETLTHIVSLNSIEDLAGNRLAPFNTSFTTGTSAGTNLNTLPNGAQISTNPSSLFADGQSTSVVTISNVNRNGVPSPDGTLIAVTAAPAFNLSSAGGTILGGVPSPDPRFRLFSTLGGTVTLTYQSPNRPDLVRGTTTSGIIQVASVDAAGRPVVQIGGGTPFITLSATNGVNISANPVNVLANGTSVSAITLFVFDRTGIAVPPGVRIAVTAQPIHAASAGGTINGGTPALDPRYRIFTVATGGLVEFTYTPPVFAPFQQGTATIQVAESDAAGNVLGLLNTGALTLNGSTGFTQPQPVLLSFSPPNVGGGWQFGTNIVATARFSRPIDPATVTPSNFNAGGLAGTITLSDSSAGPNTVATFAPALLIPNVGSFVNITTNIRSTDGEPLLAGVQYTFVTAPTTDSIPPAVATVSPADSASGVPINAPITISFTEPVNPTTLDTTTFFVSLGGTPIPGRVSATAVPGGMATFATFLPSEYLTPNTTYGVTVTAGVTDPAGNALAAPFAATFTTGAGVDNTPPTASFNPPSGSTNVPVTFTPTLTFSEPVNAGTVTTVTTSFLNGTFFLQGPEAVNIGSALTTLAMSNNNTVATLTPVNPLFAGRQYTLFSSNGITDVAGNRLTGTFSTFTTALAPGTANLPTGATAISNPASLIATGTISSTIVVTNINRNGTPVPNGTIVAVTAQQAFTNSVGGTISGASVGTSPDGRFLLFSTLGGAITVSYTPPVLSLGPNQGATVAVQIASVDLDNRPVAMIAQAPVSLSGIQSVTMVVAPTTLPANGTSTASITATFKDKNGNVLPDGALVGLTVAPVFTGSAGGTILGGTTSPGDSRIQLFTTTGGQITATYRSPTNKGSGQAVIQAVTVNPAGNGMVLIGPTTTITLQ